MAWSCVQTQGLGREVVCCNHTSCHPQPWEKVTSSVRRGRDRVGRDLDIQADGLLTSLVRLGFESQTVGIRLKLISVTYVNSRHPVPRLHIARIMLEVSINNVT